MPKIEPQHLTTQQQKWFASVREGLERETGKSLAQWVAIAKTCPETAARARLKWFKQVHGLLQNRAAYVLGEAFPADAGWSAPDVLLQALWSDPAQHAIFSAVRDAVIVLPDVVVGQRKGFSAWSRAFQFAAIKPIKGGARLGLAVPPEAHPRLVPYGKSDGWSERLQASLVLTHPSAVDEALKALISAAWARSG